MESYSDEKRGMLEIKISSAVRDSVEWLVAFEVRKELIPEKYLNTYKDGLIFTGARVITNPEDHSYLSQHIMAFKTIATQFEEWATILEGFREEGDLP